MVDQEDLKQTEIRNSAEYIAELEESNRHHKNAIKIIGHEFGGRLNSLNGFPELMISQIRKLPVSEEEKQQLIDYCLVIRRNVSQLASMSTILHLNSFSHRDLRAGSEQIDLEQMIRDNLESLKWDFLKNNLGISYEYDSEQEKSIYVHAHEGFMNSIVNTILFNLLKHAPKYSLSRLGVSIKDERLELICENLMGKSRQEYGEKTGVGFYLLDLATKHMRGKLELESHYLDRKYQYKEIIGYQNAQELPDHDIFSLRFSIPMLELTYHAPKKS